MLQEINLFDLIRFYQCLFWLQPHGLSTTTNGTRYAASPKIQSPNLQGILIEFLRVFTSCGLHYEKTL
ncbi:hypothetical protein CR513_61689, partial [Mucuna pruriens]